MLNDLLKRRRDIEKAQLDNYENYLFKKVEKSLYEVFKDKSEKELNSIELNLKNCNKKKKSFATALRTKPKHYSDDLKTFKVQIKDVLKEVEVSKDFVIINIGDIIKYKIPQINGTKLGWIRRKNSGNKMIFESPFGKNIKITNVISDEQLESMINDDDSNLEISRQDEDEATKQQA